MASVNDIFKQVPILGGMLQGPNQEIISLDPQTQGMIAEGVNRAVGQTPSDIANQSMAGVESAVRGLSPSDDMVNREAVRTGQNPYLMSAVQNKLRQETSRDLARFKSQADIQARLAKAQRMQQISQSALAGQQVQLNNFMALSQAYQQNEMARAQVISNVIGLGSTANMINKLPPGSSRRTVAALNTFNSNQDNFNTSSQIGGNNNSFGMSQGYGQFPNYTE